MIALAPVGLSHPEMKKHGKLGAGRVILVVRPRRGVQAGEALLNFGGVAAC